jgi:ferritin-like protein
LSQRRGTHLPDGRPALSASKWYQSVTAAGYRARADRAVNHPATGRTFHFRLRYNSSIKTKEPEMANEGYHEDINELSDETRDMHRAIVSLMEELEAIDWYNQRVDACKDSELRAILSHNRDEEKEHAAMVLEWIRRRDPAMDKELRDYLFMDKPVAHD